MKLSWKAHPKEPGFYYLRQFKTNLVLIAEVFFYQQKMYWKDINVPEILHKAKADDGKWAGPIMEMPE